MKVVKVLWIDSCNSNMNWTVVEDIEVEPIYIVSFGVVVKDTDEFLAIAQNYGDDPEQYSNITTIPKGCIKEISFVIYEDNKCENEQKPTDSIPKARTGLEWVNTIDDACDERYTKEYSHGEYCHKQSFKWGFQEGVDWLEKQGEQKIPVKIKTLEESLGIDSKTYNEIVNDCVFGEDKPKDYSSIDPHFGKPTDKVEPKFKVGDWILYSGDHYEGVRHITKINENGYYIERNGLPHGIIPFNHEICMKLWTIQDAKGGDVLSDGTTIFIFKDLLSDGSVMSYCDYDTDSGESDAFCPLSVNLMCSKITPTTKEQRDILMKAMSDAGWEFDFEKKELKKIEQKPAE